MAAPAYHLRTNKAIDRFLFIDVIRHIVRLEKTSQYTYYSFGGPYLDDFRLIHEIFPKMKMVSIEKNNEVFKRQKFNQPSGQLKLVHSDLNSFLSVFDTGDEKSVFWLDFTNLKLSQITAFQLLISKLSPGSVVKLTLRCEPRDHINLPNDAKNEDGTFKIDKQAKFVKTFREFLPASFTTVPKSREKFAKLLTSMIQIASQRILPRAANGNILQPVSDIHYNDNVGIYTFTGVVIEIDEEAELRSILQHLEYTNLWWRKNPTEIDIPVLSTKERLHLQAELPCSGANLKKKLGYKIDGSNSLNQLKQYSKFYREYPYFIRAVI